MTIEMFMVVLGIACATFGMSAVTTILLLTRRSTPRHFPHAPMWAGPAGVAGAGVKGPWTGSCQGSWREKGVCGGEKGEEKSGRRSRRERRRERAGQWRERHSLELNGNPPAPNTEPGFYLLETKQGTQHKAMLVEWKDQLAYVTLDRPDWVMESWTEVASLTPMHGRRDRYDHP